MATKLFLRNTATHGINDTGDANLYDMLPTAGNAYAQAVLVTWAALSEIQYGIQQGLSHPSVAWISGRAPVGGFTLTNTDVSAWLKVNDAAANLGGRYRVYKRSAAGVITELGGSPFSSAVEIPVSFAEGTVAGNVTDTVFAEDDRILVRFFGVSGVGGAASTGYTSSFRFNGADGELYDSFFNIAETVVFKGEEEPEGEFNGHQFEMELSGPGAGWTRVSRDVLLQAVSLRYGIQGNGPLDLTAGTGTLKFDLDNSEDNSAGLVGYYSPRHPNCRGGFRMGIGVRYSYREPPGYTNAVMDDVPLGYWRLEEESGTVAADSSGNGHDGEYINAPTLAQPGALSDGSVAAQFNGTDEYVNVTGFPAIPTHVTMEAWVNSSSIATDQIFVSGGTSNTNWLRIVSSKARVAIVTGGVQKFLSGDTTLVSDTWYHIVATYDGANIRLYVNGVEDKTALAETGSLTWAAATARLAAFGAPSLPLVGRLDEVAIYDRALSDAEILEHYALRTAPGQGRVHGKFIGRLREIDPEPGQYRDRLTHCLAVDWMNEAAITKYSAPTQVGMRTDEILDTIVALVPRQPESTDFDVADSTFLYALDNGLTEGATVLTEILRLCQSEYGRCYLKGGIGFWGQLRFENRTARLAPLPRVIFDGTMQKLNFGGSAAKIRNKAKVTAHPRRVDTAATTVLFAKADQSNPSVEPGATITIRGKYTDPSNPNARVGGVDMVAPVATTDYLMNAAEDGTGADLTASFAVVATYYANDVEYAITNNGGTLGYVTKLQARGRGLYDYDPLVAEVQDDISIELIGESPVELDMLYQSSITVAEAVAQFLVDTWADTGAEAPGVTEGSFQFIPRTPEELITAMELEPGDVVGLAEDVAGLNGAYYIQGVGIKITGDACVFDFGVQRAQLQAYWQLGVAGFSELGVTTVLAPL